MLRLIRVVSQLDWNDKTWHYSKATYVRINDAFIREIEEKSEQRELTDFEGEDTAQNDFQTEETHQVHVTDYYEIEGTGPGTYFMTHREYHKCFGS